MAKVSERTHPNAAAFPPGLSGPALRALQTAGIASMKDLRRWSDDQLLALHGFGPKGLALLHGARSAPRTGASSRKVASSTKSGAAVNRTAKRAPSQAAASQAPADRLRRYFAALTPAQRRVLTRMRALIRAVVPKAEEAFSYGIPAVRHEGRVLVWYAAWASHVSLYPITDAIRRAYARALGGLETSKGTVRFPLDAPLPAALIGSLVKARMREVRVQNRR